MAKYSFKFKMKIVQEYLSGSVSYKTFAKQKKNGFSKACREKANVLWSYLYKFRWVEKEYRTMDLYYNTKRIKQKLGWLSPVEYRLTNAA